MKNYLSYTTEIEGFKAVEETVRVVEKSAASHIHLLKKKVQSLAEYKNQIQETLDRLSHFYWDIEHPLLKEGSSDKKALLVITGTKGIVGGLYHELISNVITQKDDYDFIWIIGKKGVEYLSEENVETEELFREDVSEEEIQPQEITSMSLEFFNRFQSTRLRKVDILYSHFFSLAKQEPHITQFLPFDFASVSARALLNKSVDNDTLASGDNPYGFPIFEPSKKLVFNTLLKKYIDVSFAQLMLEAKLSEFAARTVTAESAIKETQRVLDSLRRAFLKDKHSAATQQQLESFSSHQTL